MLLDEGWHVVGNLSSIGVVVTGWRSCAYTPPDFRPGLLSGGVRGVDDRSPGRESGGVVVMGHARDTTNTLDA
jgi:hypothetical protein